MNHAQNLKNFQDHIESRDDGIELATSHFRGDGVYVRTVGVPEGFGFVGKTHDSNHVFMIVSGKCVVTNEFGEKTIYEAPYVMESKIGTQRTILALEDTILLNAHGVDDTLSIEEIEDVLTHMPIISLEADTQERIG